MDKQCSVCEQRAKFRCTQCNDRLYCSTACQAQDWKTNEQYRRRAMQSIGDEIPIERVPPVAKQEVIGTGSVLKIDKKVDILVGDSLGAGDLGEVYEGVDRANKNTKVAVKVFYPGAIYNDAFLQELVIHESLTENKQLCRTDGPVVCAVRALAIDVPAPGGAKDKFAQRYSIIFPFKNRVLTFERATNALRGINKTRIDVHKQNIRRAQRIMAQKFFTVLAEVHAEEVYHMDIKRDNVLVAGMQQVTGQDVLKAADLDVVLIDFGGACAPKTLDANKRARVLQRATELGIDQKATDQLTLSLVCETRSRGAGFDPRLGPEDWKRDAAFHGKQSDIYTSALMLFEIATLKSAFQLGDLRDAKGLYAKVDPDKAAGGDAELQQVLINIMQTEPSKRKDASFYAAELAKLSLK